MTQVGIVCPSSVEVFANQRYHKLYYVLLVLRKLISALGVDFSSFALPGENSSLQYLTLRFLKHHRKDLFSSPKGYPSVWPMSVAAFNVLLH